MATIYKLFNPPRVKRGKRRRYKRGCSCHNPFLTIKGNPTGIPYSGAVYRPRRRSGSRPRYTRFRRGLTRHAFGRFPKFRGRGLYRLARSLAPRGGKRKLIRRCRRTSGCRKRRRGRRSRR